MIITTDQQVGAPPARARDLTQPPDAMADTHPMSQPFRLGYYRPMACWWRSSVLLILPLALASAACTKSNPAATCAGSGTCSDPAFPYCDVDGTIDGEPGTCIAVLCKTGDIGGCSASEALVCNADGTGFDKQACANGCDDQTGCLACLPSETSCVVDTLSTCDVHGNVSSSTHCDLGCSDDRTHCDVMVPSNGLQAFLDMVPNPPDIDLENGTLDVDGATFTPASGNALSLTMFSAPAPAGGNALRVLVTNRLTLNNVIVKNGPLVRTALAVVAKADILVSGTIAIQTAGSGAVGCTGGDTSTGNAANRQYTSGAGGGGFATPGGDGGAVTGVVVGGIGGLVSGTATLVPLRGGCGGGVRAGTTSQSKGGGSMQLTSLTSLGINALIKADAPVPEGVNAGGGAGGGLLLEAPAVSMGTSASLLARGAGGDAADGTTGGVPRDDATSQLGGICGAACGGNGGNGASPTMAASAGESFRGTLGVQNDGAGGGGGGLGRIRINTADGSFTPGAQNRIAGALTTGAILRN